MKLIFSEHRSDYPHYIFPYAIWAIPEKGENPSDLFARGFLPSSRNLDRFYLCRQVRVSLSEFSLSSENRRIMRKCEGITCRLVPRAEFDFTEGRQRFCQTYADQKFGAGVMTGERLAALMSSPIVSHLLLFSDAEQKEIGLVMLYLEQPHLAYYYYSFYDLDYFSRNLGMFMMTRAVAFFAEAGFEHLALGTCYHRNALYKTQFKGAEFFTGFRWSRNLKELAFLLERDSGPMPQHLVESEAYRREFYEGGLAEITEMSVFRVSL